MRAVLLLLTLALNLAVLTFGSLDRPNAPAGLDSVPVWLCDRPQLAVCFAPGTSEEYMREWQERLWNAHRSLDYNIGDRWNTTAVTGSTGPQGNPCHITYSFPPDGTPAPGDPGSEPSELFEMMDSEFNGNTELWQSLFGQVFTRWGEVSGLTYSQEVDDGVTINGGNRGIVGVRGDVRISSIPVDGPSGVLAYNFFPDQGDMVLDASENWGSPAQNYIFLRNVVAHEHGHGWGLNHVCPANGSKLLEPYYSSGFNGPQHDDIRAVQRNYGDRYENNDEMATATALGELTQDYVVTPVSLDDNSDVDYYTFSVPSATGLTVTAQPIGHTYLDGQQQQNGSCSPGSEINTLDDNNIDLYLRDASGQNIIAQSNDRPSGQAEVIFRFNVPQGGGSYMIEISGATNNIVQLYDLEFDFFNVDDPYLTSCPIDFGSTNQGTPVTMGTIIMNPSVNPLVISAITAAEPFVVNTGVPQTVPPQGQLDISVTYPGSELGTQVGALTIEHSGPSGDLQCEMTGTTLTSSLQFVTGTTANFGEVPIATIDSARVILRAQGNTVLTINSISLTVPFGLDFGGPFEMNPTQSLTLWPRFAPTQLQTYDGFLIIDHSAPSSPDTLLLTGIGIPNLGVPDGGTAVFTYRLHTNYPNPFNPGTTIGYELARTTRVSLEVFDLEGRLVRELVDAEQAAGRHDVFFDGASLASGLYFYRLTTPEFSDIGKMVLAK